ncbi:MAG: hypothetical protein U0457_21525 [Candidatus Sericytochromatia bacterium]
MQISLFNEEEINLAIELNEKGIFWIPKSGDWFADLSNLRVNYRGEYEQSISLCLVLDQDGRSFSYLELLIDGEENGNRMKKSMSLSAEDKISKIVFLPSIKDCINLIDSGTDYEFEKLEKNTPELFKVYARKSLSGEILSYSGDTELNAFYRLLIDIY